MQKEFGNYHSKLNMDALAANKLPLRMNVIPSQSARYTSATNRKICGLGKEFQTEEPIFQHESTR